MDNPFCDFAFTYLLRSRACVRVCACARVRVCVRARVCVCVCVSACLRCRLGKADQFAYLGRGNPRAVFTTNPELHNDAEEFASMEKAFRNLGLTDDDRWNLCVSSSSSSSSS